MIPRWLQLLERALLGADDREFLAGDLREQYARERQRHGARRAAWRYAADLLRATPRRSGAALRRLRDDTTYASRVLRRRPVFSAAAVLTLAIGIGATTATFSVANAVLLTPLPYPDPERLLFVSSSFPGATGGGDQLSHLDIREIAARATTLEGIAAYHTGRALQFTSGGEPERVRVNIVDPAYLDMLGVSPALGRTLTAAGDRELERQPVVILSHGFWVHRLGSDPGVIGRTVRLSDVAFTVIGVLPPAFRDVSAEEGYGFDSDVFIPTAMLPVLGTPALLKERTSRNFWGLARVKPGRTVAQARAEIAAIGEQLQQEMAATNRGFTFWADRLDAYLARDIRGRILLLLAGSSFVLLIACANVGNLLLVHASSRQREMAVRRAIGARRRHILGLLLAEAALLALVGSALGLALGSVFEDAFAALVPGELTPRLSAAGLNTRVLLFCAALTGAVALGLALASALRLTTSAGIARVRAHGRGTTDGAAAPVRRLLLVTEIAIAVMLVVGAHLMTGSLRELRRAEPGFRTDRLLTVEMDLRSARYRDAAAVAQFGRELTAALRAVPGVESTLLWGPGRPGRNTWVTFPGREDAPADVERLMTWRHTINPGALRDLGIPLVAGREFADSDTAESPAVVVVSETLARTLWPGEDPVGKRMKWRTDVPSLPLMTVVGVAADATHRGRLNSLLYPARDVYVPHAQRSDRTIVAVVRAAEDPASVAGSIRAAVRRLDPDLPLFNMTTMEEHLAEEEAETRFAAVLMTTYAAVALLLAALGIYGVLSCQVAQRARELAVRIALGASRNDVLALVILDGMRAAIVGVAAGLAGAWGLTRFLGSLLFGVEPRDPVMFATVAITLLGVALAAAAIPAHHATRVAPLEALRSE